MAGITPCALEFIERDAIDWALKYSDIKLDIEDDINAHLLVEVDGNDIEALYVDCENIQEVVSKFECGEITLADNDSHKDMLWKLRRSIGEAVKSNSIYKEEDTVVPRAELPKLLKGVKEIGKNYGFNSVCYGHAGDGNLHINIIKGEMSDDKWNNDLTKAIKEIFTLTIDLGGTISGEHGIGYVQKDYIGIAFSKKEIELQKQIKNIFDPNNILNPGKIFN
jgi:glycolate oxidase